MKHIYRYALALASAALMCGTVAAQERAAPAAGTARPTAGHEVLRHLTPGDRRASNLIGATVKTKAGDSIGEVEDLIVSGRNNVTAAIITVGGVLGLGEQRIGIPYGQFEIAADGRSVVIDMTKEQLQSQPAFEYADPASVAASRPAATPTPSRAAPAASTARTPAPSARATTSNVSPSSARATAARENASRATGERTLKSGEQGARALIGVDVVDTGNEKIGKVRDLIVAPTGVQAVLAVNDGRLLNSRMVVVPLNSLKIQAGAEAGDEPASVQTSMTTGELAALPEFRYN
jgi:ribosomal 30S subunit maturation factor RimM